MTTNPRVFLWIGLLLLGWINYETWVRDHAPQPKTPAEMAHEAQAAAKRDAQFGESVPQAAQKPRATGGEERNSEGAPRVHAKCANGTLTSAAPTPPNAFWHMRQ